MHQFERIDKKQQQTKKKKNLKNKTKKQTKNCQITILIFE